MKFIDTHCHFNFSPFIDHFEENLRIANSAGIEKIIVPSIDIKGFSILNHFSKQHKEIYIAIGIHPINFNKYNDESNIDLMESYLKLSNKKLIAIGEIGLDRHIISGKNLYPQIYLLEIQLKLAKKYNLPVILHSCRTHDILIKYLNHYNLERTGVIHGFTGSIQQAQNFIKLGYKIGVGSIITYSRAKKTRNTIAKLPLNTLLLETDSPSMPLKDIKSTINRPEFLSKIFYTLCQLREEPSEEILNTIWCNSISLFEL